MKPSTLRSAAFVLVAALTACGGAHSESKPDAPVAVLQPTPPPEPPHTPDAEFRAKKPESLGTSSHFDAPVPVESKLKNGATLLVRPNHQLPLVAVSITFKSGVNAEPINKAGLAEFTAGMLDEGTDKLKALDLAEAIENLAAQFSASAGGESMQVHINCLVETLPQCLDLLADMVQHPAFRTADLERVRGLILTELDQKSGIPSSIANDEARRILYGAKHPLGQPDGGTSKTVQAITQADLKTFHDTWFRPNNAIISVSGDVQADQIASLLNDRFAGWKAKPLPKLKLSAVPKLTRTVTVVDKPRASQSQVWIVGRLFPATSPDAIPLRTANFILGGLFTSRLNMNLREDKAYTYGARSSVQLGRTDGSFIAAAGIFAQHAAPAVGEFEKEISRFAAGELNDDELARAKEAYIRSLPSVLETNDAVSSALGGIVATGFPSDYYKTLPEKVIAVTGADVSRVVHAHIKPAEWPAIVVGPKQLALDQLKQMNLGPVLEHNPDGTDAPPSAGVGATAK